MRLVIGVFLIVLLVIVYSSKVDIHDKLTISSVIRTVDLTSQTAQVKVEYSLKNLGTTDINYFLHAVSDKESKHLSWISASDSKKLSAKFVVSSVSVNGAPSGFSFYKVELLNILAPSASMTLIVEYVVTQTLTPYPTEIAQEENQFVF